MTEKRIIGANDYMRRNGNSDSDSETETPRIVNIDKFTWQEGDIELVYREENAEFDQDATKAELRRWRDKTRRRGKPTDWNSDTLPQTTIKAVRLAQDILPDPVQAFSFLKAVADERRNIEKGMAEELEEIFHEFVSKFSDAVRNSTEPPWEEFEERVQTAIDKRISGVMVDSALRQAAEIGVSFDPAVVNAAALKWAREYGYTLIKGINETSRKSVQEAMSRFVSTPGMTREDLEKLLSPTFGSVRAEMIAVTEVTRAASEAAKYYQGYLGETGIESKRVWRTLEDEKVCPICGPLDGKTEDEWGEKYIGGPPAHVKCRCSVTLRL